MFSGLYVRNWYADMVCGIDMRNCCADPVSGFDEDAVLVVCS